MKFLKKILNFPSFLYSYLKVQGGRRFSTSKAINKRPFFCQDWIQNGQNSIPVYSLSVRTNYLSSFFVKNGIWSITHNVNASNIVLDWKCKKCIFWYFDTFSIFITATKNMIFLNDSGYISFFHSVLTISQCELGTLHFIALFMYVF